MYTSFNRGTAVAVAASAAVVILSTVLFPQATAADAVAANADDVELFEVSFIFPQKGRRPGSNLGTPIREHLSYSPLRPWCH